MKIKYHGHSCFELSTDKHRILIDPFLKPNNPKAKVSAEEIDAPTHIILTHGHVDHVADARHLFDLHADAHLIAMVEIAEWYHGDGVENVSDPNLGGTVEFDWGWVRYVPAFHTNTLPDGSSIGQAAGVIVNLDGTTVYHLGDTCLFSDLELHASRDQPDIAIIPIGGHYTMDRHDAVKAAEWVGAATVIPCHYDTFPPIETDAEAFKSDTESETDASVVILGVGDTHDASSGETSTSDSEGGSLEDEGEYEAEAPEASSGTG
ncbi:MAG: metal-dependent hydrolase [Solirubrobacterales bacterium]